MAYDLNNMRGVLVERGDSTDVTLLAVAEMQDRTQSRIRLTCDEFDGNTLRYTYSEANDHSEEQGPRFEFLRLATRTVDQTVANIRVEVRNTTDGRYLGISATQAPDGLRQLGLKLEANKQYTLQI